MTRLLADEGVERAIVQALRVESYDVAWGVEIARGADDERVIALAAQEQRVLITNDKDFGNLAVRQGYSVNGVVLLRLPQSTAEQKAVRVLQVLQMLGERLSGYFTVITERAHASVGYPIYFPIYLGIARGMCRNSCTSSF